IQTQAAIDDLTKLLSESAFRTRLARELDMLDVPSISCILIDLDFFSIVNRLHGFAAGNDLLRNLAAHIGTLAASTCKYLAHFGGGRFAALLPNSSEATALAWAESVRESVSAVETQVAGDAISVTVSLGVAGDMDGSTSASEVIQRAEHALWMAKSSGRDCVARHGQFESETGEWEDLARQGRLFDTTVARDVMIPCARFLRPEEELEHAAETFQQTQLDKLPVLDHQGRILGLLSKHRIHDDQTSNAHWQATVGDLMDTNVKTVPENEPFTKLMEFFMNDDPRHYVAMVVRHDKPLGIVYRSGLAALSEPLALTSFAPDQPYSTSSDYLVVRETWSAQQLRPEA
ncbi:MAG: diguanylate cyclase, partial [Planctomycetota bacterium]